MRVLACRCVVTERAPSAVRHCDIWASKKETTTKTTLVGRTPRQQDSSFTGHRVLVARTSAANGTSAFSESLDMARHDGKTLVPEDAPFRTLKVQMNVPAEAEHLSFGFYSKNSHVRVRNVKLLTMERNKSSKPVGIDATADVPYNILVMPGYKIGSDRTNLSFEDSASEVVRQAAGKGDDESTVKQKEEFAFTFEGTPGRCAPPCAPPWVTLAESDHATRYLRKAKGDIVARRCYVWFCVKGGRNNCW